MENLIDGRAIAAELNAETRQKVEALAARGIQPHIAFVRVGEDPASKVYVGMKERTSGELGLKSTTHVLPEGTTEAELLTGLAEGATIVTHPGETVADGGPVVARQVP